MRTPDGLSCDNCGGAVMSTTVPLDDGSVYCDRCVASARRSNATTPVASSSEPAAGIAVEQEEKSAERLTENAESVFAAVGEALRLAAGARSDGFALRIMLSISFDVVQMTPDWTSAVSRDVPPIRGKAALSWLASASNLLRGQTVEDWLGNKFAREAPSIWKMALENLRASLPESDVDAAEPERKNDTALQRREEARHSDEEG